MRTFLLTSSLVAALALSACATTSPTSTYDAIRDEVSAAARPAPTVQLDEAVSRALLPPVSELAQQMPKARQALDERFDVAFNNVPAQQFFNSLVAGTRYNMLVSPQVSGNISANLKDVTLTEALDAVRDLYGYDYTIEGTRIYIRPLTMQTRMYRVNYLVGMRQGASNLRVSSTSVGTAVENNNPNGTNLNQQNGTGGSQPPGQNQNNQNNQNNPNGQQNYRSDSSAVRTTSSNDFWGDLKEAIEAIVGKEPGRSVVVSAQSGVLVVKAMPDELRNVDQFLKATQLAVDRQVILEAKILEVELNDSYQSGINWASFGTFSGGNGARSGGMINPGSQLSTGGTLTSGPLSAVPGSTLSLANQGANALFGLAFQTQHFAALLSFLESQGTVHVLSSPRVAAVNNQKALLKVGTDEFFVTGITTTTTTNAGGNTVIPSVTVQPFFSGVVLDVTPQIDENDNIVLHVHPSVSQVSTVNKTVNLGTLGNMSLPLAASDTSEIDTIVRGQNGQVVAIGGLMRQSASDDMAGVPGSSRLGPVIGSLFGNKSRVSQKRELVVLIKPTIVEGSASWNDNLLDTSRRIEALNPRGRNAQ
ncbi:secretin N-terminal domain-containing protein [Pseudoduganella sp. GCM10020061]|uniref:secretin N-terminal domain-containing protein n=1 Tax=Pseudoduganella sp. GCM10020061 TaxID=3317345 RepID=UPI003636B673